MTKNWTPLAITWFVLAILGLINTWTFNAFAIIHMRDFIGDWVGSGPAVSSLTVDLLVVAVAGSILIIVEAKRLGMKRGWLYVDARVTQVRAIRNPLPGNLSAT